MLVWKNFSHKRLLGPKRLKEFEFQIILGPKTLGQNIFWVLNEMCNPKYLGHEKTFGLMRKIWVKKIWVQNLLVYKQARIIERELRRRIWKHKVIIDFLIDYIICDCIFD